MKFTNADIIGRLQNDDRDAFDTLYCAYSHKVYLNALKITKNRAVAQDVVQEVFIVLWEKRLSIDPSKPVLNWIIIVSYHKSIDYLRKSIKASFCSEELTYSLPIEPHLEDFYLRECQLDLIETAIGQLSPQRKRVFELCKLKGESYERVAQTMNISKHTVKEYLSTAMKSIKEYVVLNEQFV